LKAEERRAARWRPGAVHHHFDKRGFRSVALRVACPRGRLRIDQ